ncbi:MAG: translation initiation factor IF-3 [Nitrospirae bacterium CG2_30_53_67]|nr:MAG: translation initiation factor IF-3 [Nitrospirae bacterium CG2_30_53_67]
MNQDIRAPEVRVVGDDGSQMGILPVSEALRICEEKGLDLVEIAPTAKPPVCRIMDYGKFLYQKSKKASIARKKQQVILVKEVKLRPNTEEHDLSFKVGHAERFLKEGNKAKISVMFRGREMMYSDRGKKLLSEFIEKLSEICTVEQLPRMEGRNMIMILAPKSSGAASRKKMNHS